MQEQYFVLKSCKNPRKTGWYSTIQHFISRIICVCTFLQMTVVTLTSRPVFGAGLFVDFVIFGILCIQRPCIFNIHTSVHYFAYNKKRATLHSTKIVPRDYVTYFCKQ